MFSVVSSFAFLLSFKLQWSAIIIDVLYWTLWYLLSIHSPGCVAKVLPFVFVILSLLLCMLFHLRSWNFKKFKKADRRSLPFEDLATIECLSLLNLNQRIRMWLAFVCKGRLMGSKSAVIEVSKCVGIMERNWSLYETSKLPTSCHRISTFHSLHHCRFNCQNRT